MSKVQTPVEKIQADFEAIIKFLDEKFGKDYSQKNPGLVQHLMDQTQREEDRAFTRLLNKV